MLPEFSIQAVKLQANSRQPKPVKYVPPKPKSPVQKRSCIQKQQVLASQQKAVTKSKTSTERLTRKVSEDFQQEAQYSTRSVIYMNIKQINNYTKQRD